MKSQVHSMPQNEKSNLSKEKNDFVIQNSIYAGSIAGINSCLIFHPFDVVRTKMQASVGDIGRSTHSKAIGGISSSSGPISVISHTYTNGGLRAFYTGISLPLAAQAVYKSTVLTTNLVAADLLKTWKTKGTNEEYQMTLSDHFICGSISGAVNALLFVCPVEYVRNQLIQHHTVKSQGEVVDKANSMRGPIDVLKRTLKMDGILGLWRGAGITLMRDSIGCGAFFIMNDIGKRHIERRTGLKEGSLANTLGSGFMAGFGYWFVSLPLDTLKTLVQTGKTSSSLGTVSFLIKNGGIVGALKHLYRGWQMAFGRGLPSAAITLTTYSVAYNYFQQIST